MTLHGVTSVDSDAFSNVAGPARRRPSRLLLSSGMRSTMGVNWMNNYRNSTIYGHPQEPTTGRLTVELIEEIAILSGSYGLWAGCAAGDTGAAMVFKVG